MARELRPNVFRGNWKEGYRSPDFFYEGLEVLIPWGEGKSLPCNVVCAAGDMARIVNEKHGIDKWVETLDVAVRDPRNI